MRRVRIFTDGSCLGNPGSGGWAAIIEEPGVPGGRKEIAGGYRHTTNNRMEIMAAISALKCLETDCDVEIHTDSQYLSNAISTGWIVNWEKRNWQNVKNADLWQTLIALLKRHRVKMRWVKGHAGHPENERCDVLAKKQARRNDLPPDENYEKPENQLLNAGNNLIDVASVQSFDLTDIPPGRRIYLASPYTAPETYLRKLRYKAACEAAAALSRQGHLLFSPIAHSHPVAEYGLPKDFHFWRNWCLSFLDSWATHFCILKIDGWEKSVGIKAEMEYAREKGLPILSIDQEQAQMCSDADLKKEYQEYRKCHLLSGSWPMSFKSFIRDRGK